MALSRSTSLATYKRDASSTAAENRQRQENSPEGGHVLLAGRDLHPYQQPTPALELAAALAQKAYL